MTATASGCETKLLAVTVSENVNVASVANYVGATKVGLTAPVELNSTVVPLVWFQARDNARSAVSLLPLPSSGIVVPSATV